MAHRPPLSEHPCRVPGLAPWHPEHRGEDRVAALDPHLVDQGVQLVLADPQLGKLGVLLVDPLAAGVIGQGAGLEGVQEEQTARRVSRWYRHDM
jgi:hypothetical protein